MIFEFAKEKCPVNMYSIIYVEKTFCYVMFCFHLWVHLLLDDFYELMFCVFILAFVSDSYQVFIPVPVFCPPGSISFCLHPNRTVQRFSPLSSWQGAGQHAGRQGTGYVLIRKAAGSELLTGSLSLTQVLTSSQGTT